MNILIVIDMLNGFCREGYPLSLPNSTIEIESYIASRITKIRNENGKIIFVCDEHSLDDPEIGRPYPPHCLKGTFEAEIVDSLKPFIKESLVLKKKTLSIFLNTQLEDILEKMKPTQIEVTGVCADICDLFAVYELRIRGYEVFVSTKGVLSLDPNKQNEFLNYFKNRLGATIE
ncbi:cysteine hydrolase family protein [Methylovulum miyakonense]|uniref:cysteine hydrolase family protein n=1 Tax=Methylovulum miyakonense TaxID=645578 RepID=UPI00036BC46C|nr:isochorismatase family cysteine hydrolase [Methylovulum miyakonense]